MFSASGSQLMMLTTVTVVLLLSVAPAARCKIHHLALRNDARRNIKLTTFGYNKGGTFSLKLYNFTVPEELVSPGVTPEMRNTDRFGVIGFTFSRGKDVLRGIAWEPHVCQLSQIDQGFDALFFVFNFTQNSLKVIRTGAIHDLQLCRDLESCQDSSEPASLEAPPSDSAQPSNKLQDSSSNGIFGKLHNMLFPTTATGIAFKDYLPLTLSGDQYSTSMAVRFMEGQQGKYSFIYHNCFNYRARGYRKQVAVHFTVDFVERNPGSYLSAGDIAKPNLYLYMSATFALAACFWIRYICRSSSDTVYKVHHLMTALVILKSLSLFFHGINYYFVSVYGHQREVWAIVFYITHLLKGALLFGTLILIGTGYTFFKQFLSDHDRKLFMIVLPLQVMDNVAMIIVEESEFGEQSYDFWLVAFLLIDIICCLAIITPFIRSVRHLESGAGIDGKAAFNIEKLRLFRHFYVITIGYIYLTRIVKLIVGSVAPFNYEWISDAIAEFSTLLFFIIAGYQFRPQERNPYLALVQEEDNYDIHSTKSAAVENVSLLKRTSIRNEMRGQTSSTKGRTGEDLEDSDPEDIFYERGTKPLPRSSVL